MSGLIINHNLGSMGALSALNQNQNGLQSALQQLSTGKRINGAADDAAGLAISQKMQAQINGLNQAGQNAQDGISLLQTADGALNETQSILQRMRQLATQAANDTNTTSDRQSMQDEVTQLTQEIDRIANTTQFNTQNLLSGNLGLSTTDGAALTQLTDTGATTAGTVKFQAATTFTAATNATATLDLSASATGVAAQAGTLSVTVNGSTTNVGFNQNESFSDIAASINSSVSGVTAAYDTTTRKLTITSNVANAQQSVSAKTDSDAELEAGDTFSTVGSTDVAGADASLAAGSVKDSNGTTVANMTFNGNTVTFNSGAQQGLSFVINGASGATVDVSNQSISVGGGLTLQIGANANQTMQIQINAMDSQNLGVSSVDVTTQQGAEQAITSLDSALTTVSNQRAQLGAYENRLQHTMNNLSTSSDNLTTAESAITDTNMAATMATFTQDNVLQQAAVSMLAQANQQPQLVLKLLG